MSNRRLIERQVSLLAHLTSAATIFGDGEIRDPALHGMNAGRLKLVATSSNGKRMSKVQFVLPRTFGLLGDRAPGLARDFVDACPPVDIGRLANARQFHDFLCDRWRREVPEPPYLPDVAACEIALAKTQPVASGPEEPPPTRRPAIRRPSDAALLRCAYDVRAVFEKAADGVAPAPRETFLFVGWSAAAEARVLEIPPALYTLLGALDRWTPVDALDTGGGLGARQLLDALVAHEMVHLAP